MAVLLGVTSLTKREFRQYGRISVASVQQRFGSWNRAIEIAGLTPNPPQHLNGQPMLSEDALLEEIIRLSEELGKSPTANEMSAFGRFSPDPYRKRWGSFSEAVKIAYAKYGIPTGISRVISPSSTTEIAEVSTEPTQPAPNIYKTYPQRKKVQYGEPIDFRGLRHAPVNEQGVVYMFGMVSRELGFLIESLRTAYPDCEGKRCVDEKRQLWENVLIEFEFRSSNFREHGHNPEGCDLVVCWIHDWEDCQLEVLELRSAISYLSNQ